MKIQTEEEKRAAKIETYAEALDFFIEDPKAISDPSLRTCIDFFKERIAQEEEKRSKSLGMQKPLIRA